LLSDIDGIAAMMIDAAKIARATIMESAFHRFEPQGVSGTVILAESHLSIHTWPEKGYAAMDFYTCGDHTDPWRAQARHREERRRFHACIDGQSRRARAYGVAGERFLNRHHQQLSSLRAHQLGRLGALAVQFCDCYSQAFSIEVKTTFMRLSTLRTGLLATIAVALASCSSNGMMPSYSSPVSQPEAAPVSQGAPDARLGAPIGDQTEGETAASPDAADSMSPDVAKCAKSPPQYDWIFKGACSSFTLKPTGGNFSLGTYDSISVKGSLGYNTVKSSAKVYVSDAIGNGDIGKYKGKSYPKYNGKGKVVLYAAADNQTTQTIKPKTHAGVPIFKYVITDSKGLPGKSCNAAIYGNNKWTPLPGQGFPVKGKTVTIQQYNAPNGFVLPPKGYALYFAVNCY
jgi:S-adenosylmethionine decarboxylase proenzyme